MPELRLNTGKASNITMTLRQRNTLRGSNCGPHCLSSPISPQVNGQESRVVNKHTVSSLK